MIEQEIEKQKAYIQTLADGKHKKANLKKGIPMNKRSEGELKILGRKGGIASRKARQEKKTMRQLAEICLGAKLTKP